MFLPLTVVLVVLSLHSLLCLAHFRKDIRLIEVRPRELTNVREPVARMEINLLLTLAARDKTRSHLVDALYWILSSSPLFLHFGQQYLILWFSFLAGTSSWSTCPPPMPWMLWRMQMDTSWISSTLSESTSSQTLISECSNWVLPVDLGILILSACMECNQPNCSFRYMTISDEWEIPEKQPFKDLVRNFRKSGQNIQLNIKWLLHCWNVHMKIERMC